MVSVERARSLRSWARENGVRIGSKAIYVADAGLPRPILHEEIRAVDIQTSLLSPLALLFPAIAAAIGSAVTYIAYGQPLASGERPLTLWGLCFPALTIGYAIHEVRHYVTHRRHTIVLHAPSIILKPIRVIWADSKDDIEDLRALIVEAGKRS